MYLIFVVDYDPAGWIIRNSVIRDIDFYGIKNIKAIDIITPDILTPEQLKLARIPLSKGREAINTQWMERTGGIHDEPYGFESDSVPFERLRKEIIEAATAYVGNPEIIRRSNTIEELRKMLNWLIQIKIGLTTEL